MRASVLALVCLLGTASAYADEPARELAPVDPLDTEDDAAPPDIIGTDDAGAHDAARGAEQNEWLPKRTTWGADYLALANAPEFLPRTYVYLSSRTGGTAHPQKLRFAAEYALHLPFYSSLRKVAAGEAEHFAWSITLFFRGDLRMFARESNPVTMPSYKPGLSLQFFWLARPARDHRVLYGARVEAYHYSNGQDRCTWSRELPDEPLDQPRGPCSTLFVQLHDPAAQLNRYSGEFSTNRALLALDTKYMWLDSRGLAYRALSGGLTGEINVPWLPGGIENLYRDVYGWGTLEAHAEGERWLLPNLMMRLRASYSYAIASAAKIPSSSGLLELAAHPYPKLIGQFGLFARYYGGRDFYNAFFVDRIQTFSFGLVWSDSPSLKFEKGQQ